MSRSRPPVVPSPVAPVLGRRSALRLLGLAGLGGLAGCMAAGEARPLLLSMRGQLPRRLLERLPSPWRSREVADDRRDRRALAEGASAPDLLGLSDGWAEELPASALQPLAAAGPVARLADWVPAALTRRMGAGDDVTALPVAFSPWVIVHRSAALRDQAGRGWELLLDPELRGALVLPASPRIVIDLARRLPRGLEDLPALRRQAFGHDDRHGLNQLLAGEVAAVVCQARWLVPLLRSDPRLSAVLPDSGSVLGWTLLLRPRGSREPLPQPWLEAAWRPPLLPRLASGGWLPPLPAPELEPALAVLPERVRSLVLPPAPVLARCTTFAPLASAERRSLQGIWDDSAPS